MEASGNQRRSSSNTMETWCKLRFLITGGSGLLGSKVAETAILDGHEVYSGFNQHESRAGIPVKLDLNSQENVVKVFDLVEPEIVVHAGAISNVDQCEANKELAWGINVDGTKRMSELSREHNAFLVYVSTDYVFSGKRGMYTETDETKPINYYGKTKLEGEKIVSMLTSESCIARPSVIYGSVPAAGKINFALWVLDKLRKGEQIKIITDQCISPTFNTNLADMIIEVAQRRLTGIYHLAGATAVNRYDFACLLAKIFDLDAGLIKPTKSEDMNWTAKRPKNTSLVVDKASRVLHKKPLKLEDALGNLRKELVTES
ncbi:MAG: dTDP-4-dehydrorhamnose reductase [Candidatus Bathyarchaeota archaeon]|nr:dTDP-4-dehydrorhamnose reductase [Candidatus Bathyarchaeum sp.]